MDTNTYYQRLKKLQEQAEAALLSNDNIAANRVAQRVLTLNTDQTHWNYGNGIHSANQILGLSALQINDINCCTAGKAIKC